MFVIYANEHVSCIDIFYMIQGQSDRKKGGDTPYLVRSEMVMVRNSESDKFSHLITSCQVVGIYV